MSLTNNVIRPLAAAILAAVVANCTEGCGGVQISPAEAYAMEISGCVTQRNRDVLWCAQDASSREESKACREDAEEKERQCRSMVDKKYGLYNASGSYPSYP